MMSGSNFKLHEEHWQILVEFMENHRDFACGRLSSINGRETRRKLWSELVNNLNSLGYGTRPVEKWQKCWADYKSNLKKKAAQIKSSQQKTGGGPILEDKLTDLELRVLNIMGHTSYEGCGTKELGFEDSILSPTILSNLQVQNESDVSIIEGLESNSIEILDNIHTNTPTNNKSSVKKDIGSRSKRSIASACEDHDYLVKERGKFKNKKLCKNQEDICEETLVILKNIENTLNIGLANISETLNRNFAALCDILSQKQRHQQ